MGTEERDWVDVANDILSRCHINLRVKRLTDCDANVFVAFYQAILGEKVPDHIPTPGSQEDDMHNVQSVIDSLALDYLQISLSHITGENIVRGDNESIKNLLEIFDGLLDYLTEQLSEEEEEEHSGDAKHNGGTQPERTEDAEERLSQISSAQSAVQSSKHSIHSWNGEESESTAELIRLGDSAHTFTANQGVRADDLPAVEAPLPELPDGLEGTSNRATLLREPIRSAIPLQAPYQTTPQRLDGPPPQSASAGPSKAPSATQPEEPAILSRESPTPQSHGLSSNGQQSPLVPHSPAESEQSAPSQRKSQPEATNAGPRRVLFRSQPDVLLLSLRNELDGTDVRNKPEEEEEEEEEDEDEEKDEDHDLSSSSENRHHRGIGERWVDGLQDESLSRRSQRNRAAELELHDMSEKLSRRLEELDLMLKTALGRAGESGETKEEDKHSHHSDSIMECRRRRGPMDSATVPRRPRARSLSPSPPPACRSLQEQSATDPHHGPPQPKEHARRKEQRERHRQRRQDQMMSKAYEDELKRLEDQERAELAYERARAQSAEREYREAVLKDVPGIPKPSQIYGPKMTTPRKSPRAKHSAAGRRQTQPRRPTPMKVKENDLLPALLDEFPHLQLSSHALGRMWKQQLRQVDQLHAPENQRGRTKLVHQLDEAQKRHDLLVEIIRKEQEHNRRLRDFRERVQQSKWSQNKLREQRQQVARAKKYHNDYHVQFRARLMRARTREEKMFKQIFEEGLELQKARLREQRAYAKDQRQKHHQRHVDEIEAMENYYRDQFSLLAETLAQEREEIQVRKKAQEKALQKMKRELRSKMEREIGDLQRLIVQNDEDDYFRHLEVERLRGRLQMASFQYGTSCLH